MSVATWSFLDLPVCNFLPVTPIRLVNSRFDVHVNIFQGNRPLEDSRLDIGSDCLQTADNLLSFLGTKDPHFSQHFCVCNGAGNILLVQTLVEVHRRGESFHELVGRLGESSSPKACQRLFRYSCWSR